MASNATSKKHQKKQTADIDQLRRLLPGMNANKSEAEVMEATTKYIEALENTLFGQTRTHGYPEKLKPYSSANRADDYDSIRKAVATGK